MSWQTDDGRHEGWTAAEFAGGWFSVGANSDGALVRQFAPGPLRNQRANVLGEDFLDGRTAIGWRGMCECGWRGPLWRLVATAAEAAPDARRIHVPDLTSSGFAPEILEDTVWDEWKSHLEPASITAVAAAAEAARDAEARLDAAVRAARDDGRSWEAIGDAVGITRQSAHTRWAKR